MKIRGAAEKAARGPKNRAEKIQEENFAYYLNVLERFLWSYSKFVTNFVIAIQIYVKNFKTANVNSKKPQTRLSVNINKIATLRNARGENRPSLEQVALDCQQFGAEGITVHPRPDERHVKRADVFNLRPLVKVEFNIEGYPSPEFMDLVLKVRPEQVTLVPDIPSALTSSEGWEVEPNQEFLAGIVERLKDAGIRSSIFVGTDLENIKAAAATGTDRIELYTKPYADFYEKDREKAVEPYVAASITAHNLGLGVNAGHDLSLENLAFFHESLPWLHEVSIGHALVCDALYLGLEETIKRYKECLMP